jgi:hypothetical protein
MGVSAGPTFCTWSCNNDDFGGQSCPNDANGIQGICVTGIGNTLVGHEDDFGFCFQDCSSGGTCPDGESCQSAQAYSGGNGSTMVCVPAPTDPLSGTSWQSNTITPEANDGVSTSTYAITFGTATMFMSGAAIGPFSATFTQTYGASASSYAGCTETTTFTGGEWADVPGTTMGMGALSVSGASGSTNRTSCASSSDDVTGATGVYDDAVNGQNGATYTISNTTMMTLMKDSGVTPYTGSSYWAFTKM